MDVMTNTPAVTSTTVVVTTITNTEILEKAYVVEFVQVKHRF